MSLITNYGQAEANLKKRGVASANKMVKQLVLVLAVVSAFTSKSLAVMTGFDLYVGTFQSGNGNPEARWTWNVNGVSTDGYFQWECGFIIAGSILRSHAHIDQDLKPDTSYSATINAGSDICDAFAIISRPGCYDLYIQDPLVGGGYQLNNTYPNWRTGYMLERYPNDPLYNTTSFSFQYYIDPNTSSEPAAIWNVKNQSGIPVSRSPKKRHYPMASDGSSKAYAAVQNTTYPVTFAIIGNARGCTLANVGNGAIFSASTNQGTVEVAALTADPNPCLVTNFWFDLFDGECQDCKSAGNCDLWTGVDSVNIKFGLGQSRQGANNAFLQVKSDVPSLSLGTPGSIQCNFIRSDLNVITNSQGWLRQVASLDRVIDIITNTATGYFVNFYHYADVLGFSATNGLYVFANPAFRTVLVSLVNGDTNHLQVMDSSGPTSDYYWGTNGWSMTTGGGLRNESVTTAINGATYTKTRIIKNAQGGIDYQSSETWQNFSYGARLISKTSGSCPMMQVETNTYTADGMMQQSVHSDGSWDIYNYDSNGRQVGHYSPFLNSAPTTNSSLCRYTASTYDNSVVSGSGNDTNLDFYAPRMVVDYVLANEVHRSYTVVKSGERDDIECVSPGAAWNGPSNLVTVTYSFQDAANLGKPSKIVRPDGIIQLFTYETGVNAPIQGSTASGFNRSFEKTTVWTGAPDYTWNNVVDGTIDETWTDVMQQNVLHRVTDIASQIIIAQEKMYYDDRSHLTNTVYLNRSSVKQNYDCCNLASSVAPDGTVTSYGYDALKRRNMTVQNGIISSNILNANGDVLGTLRFGTDGLVVTNGFSTYTDGGLLVASKDALGNVTSYTNYFDGSGQLIRITTNPDLSTRMETYAKDGSLFKVTGTAVASAMRFTNGMELEGGVQRPYRQEIKLDANGADTAEWTKTYTDLLGRDYKTVYASASGTPASQTFYNAVGQPVKQVDPDGVTTLVQYNAKGQVAYSATDMNTNGVIDFAGNDRISYTVSDVVSNGYNLYVNRTRTYVWNTANFNSSNLVSMSMNSVDGLQSWNVIYNNGVGLTNCSLMVYDPANGFAVSTGFAPDKSYSVGTSQYGRLVSVVRYDALNSQLSSVNYGYDVQGRPNTMTDARNGTTTSLFNAADQTTG